MAEICLYAKHSGKWVKPGVYQEGGTLTLLLPTKLNYQSLMQTLYARLNVTPATHSINVKHEADGLVPPTIDDDESLRCYLYLRKNEPNRTKLNLVLEISPEAFQDKKADYASSPRVGSTPTPNTSESGFGCNRSRIIPNMPSPISEAREWDVPSPEAFDNDTVGLDDMNTVSQATPQPRRSPPPVILSIEAPPQTQHQEEPPLPPQPPTRSQRKENVSSQENGGCSVTAPESNTCVESNDIEVLDILSPVSVKKRIICKQSGVVEAFADGCNQ